MKMTQVLCQAAAAQARRPSIQFIGRRTPPTNIDHTAHAHPEAPSGTLPDSFVAYRSKAQQHGPLTHRPSLSSISGSIGGSSGKALGPVEPAKGQVFDRSELPSRFWRLPWTQAEIEAVETGGASMSA